MEVGRGVFPMDLGERPEHEEPSRGLRDDPDPRRHKRARGSSAAERLDGPFRIPVALRRGRIRLGRYSGPPERPLAVGWHELDLDERGEHRKPDRRVWDGANTSQLERAG